MPNANVKAIAQVCATSNASGLKPYVWITTEPEVSVIPAATAKVISTDITMTPASAGPPAVLLGKFVKWAVSQVPSKNIWESTNIGDADSGATQTTVTVFIPKMTAARLDALYGGCSFILGVPDMNGEMRLVGEKDNGANAKYTESITDATNGVTVVFTWISGYSPNFYTGDFPG